MHVIYHSSLPTRGEPDCRSRLVAGPGLGSAQLEVVWLEVLPASRVAPNVDGRHRVVLALEGSGKQRLAGSPQSFCAPCTLIVPAGVEHEIVNNGAVALKLIAICCGEPGAHDSPRRIEPLA